MKKRRFRRRKDSYVEDGLERTNVPTRQVDNSLYPTAQMSARAIGLPNNSAFNVVGNNMPLGLPQYTSVDEFGRAYTPIMHYGPQPVSAPMPIAKPAEIVQLAPIVSPVAFVPFSAQEDKPESQE